MTQLEYDIAEWLITHQDGLQSIIVSQTIPSPLINENASYRAIYEDQIVDLIKNEVNNTFNLNPEQLNDIINKEWIISLGINIKLGIK